MRVVSTNCLVESSRERPRRPFFVRSRCRLVKLTKCMYLPGFEEEGLVSDGELEWAKQGKSA